MPPTTVSVPEYMAERNDSEYGCTRTQQELTSLGTQCDGPGGWLSVNLVADEERTASLFKLSMACRSSLLQDSYPTTKIR